MRLATLPLCAALALGACGGGDELSTTEYRAEARKICTEANRASDRIRQPTRSTPKAIADYFRRQLAPAERATTRFAELEPPSELEDAHADQLRTSRAGIAEVRRLVGRLERGDDPRQVLAGAQDSIRRLTREADAAARRLGVPECGD